MAGTGIDTSILRKGAHSASSFDLSRGAGEEECEETRRLLSRDCRAIAAELARVPGRTLFPAQGDFILVKLPTEPVDTRRGWNTPVDDTPDNLVPYPSRRKTDDTGRRAVNA